MKKHYFTKAEMSLWCVSVLLIACLLYTSDAADDMRGV